MTRSDEQKPQAAHEGQKGEKGKKRKGSRLKAFYQTGPVLCLTPLSLWPLRAFRLAPSFSYFHSHDFSLVFPLASTSNSNTTARVFRRANFGDAVL